MCTISNQFNCTPNTVALVISANRLVRTAISRRTSTVPLTRWTPFACLSTNVFSRNGPRCGKEDTLPFQKLQRQMSWKSEVRTSKEMTAPKIYFCTLLLLQCIWRTWIFHKASLMYVANHPIDWLRLGTTASRFTHSNWHWNMIGTAKSVSWASSCTGSAAQRRESASYIISCDTSGVQWSRTVCVYGCIR